MECQQSEPIHCCSLPTFGRRAPATDQLGTCRWRSSSVTLCVRPAITSPIGACGLASAPALTGPRQVRDLDAVQPPLSSTRRAIHHEMELQRMPRIVAYRAQLVVNVPPKSLRRRNLPPSKHGHSPAMHPQQRNSSTLGHPYDPLGDRLQSSYVGFAGEKGPRVGDRQRSCRVWRRRGSLRES